MIGSWWFILFLSPLSGTIIAEIVWRLVNHRYGQYLWLTVTAGIVVSTLPVIGLQLLGVMTSAPYGNAWGFLNILVTVVHIALAVGTAIARLRLR